MTRNLFVAVKILRIILIESTQFCEFCIIDFINLAFFLDFN